MLLLSLPRVTINMGDFEDGGVRVEVEDLHKVLVLPRPTLGTVAVFHHKCTLLPRISSSGASSGHLMQLPSRSFPSTWVLTSNFVMYERRGQLYIHSLDNRRLLCLKEHQANVRASGWRVLVKIKADPVLG